MTFQCVCLIMALVSRAVIHNNLRFAILAELCEDIVGDQVKALNKVNEVRALVRCAFGDVLYSMKQKISAHSSKIGTSTGVSQCLRWRGRGTWVVPLIFAALH